MTDSVKRLQTSMIIETGTFYIASNQKDKYYE
jgi:hypothetical protein